VAILGCLIWGMRIVRIVCGLSHRGYGFMPVSCS
jgi:hypothetical protein